MLLQEILCNVCPVFNQEETIKCVVENGRHVPSGQCMMGHPACPAGWDVRGLRSTVFERGSLRRQTLGYERKLGRKEMDVECDEGVAWTRLGHLLPRIECLTRRGHCC